MKNPLLEIIDLSKKFDLISHKSEQFWALKNINLSGHKGEIIGVTGANGSGKTTLFRIIAGIYRPDSGIIRNNASQMRSIMSTEAGLIPDRSGRYNLFHYGALIGVLKKDLLIKMDEIIEFAELKEFIDEPVRTYSTGMKSRLTFSIFSAFKSDLFLLDETFSAGDVVFRKRAIDRMKINAKRNNSLVLMISHNAQELYDHCDNCIGLHKGRRVAFDNSKIFHDSYFSGNTEGHLSDEQLQFYHKKYELFRLYDFSYYPYSSTLNEHVDKFIFEINCIQNMIVPLQLSLQAQLSVNESVYFQTTLINPILVNDESNYKYKFALEKKDLMPTSRLHIHVINEYNEVIFSFFNLWNNL